MYFIGDLKRNSKGNDREALFKEIIIEDYSNTNYFFFKFQIDKTNGSENNLSSREYKCSGGEIIFKAAEGKRHIAFRRTAAA